MTTKRNVVVTNSIDMAGMLAAKDEARIHLLGGLLYNGQRMIYGPRAIEMMGIIISIKPLLAPAAYRWKA